MNFAEYIVKSDHREMKANVKIFRDIDELKIWGNDLGFRFHRDPDDKTKYKVTLTDADVDKLESFVRQQQIRIELLESDRNRTQRALQEKVAKQQAEIEALKAKILTDEEILDFINGFCTDMGDYWDLNENNAVPMIRAILRKVNEK